MSDNDIDLIKIQAIEKRIFQNLQGILDQDKAREKELNEVKHQLAAFKGKIIAQDGEVAELRRQLGLLQQQFYAKGTTSYGDNSGLDNQNNQHPTS